MWKIVKSGCTAKKRYVLQNTHSGICNYASSEQRMLRVINYGADSGWSPLQTDSIFNRLKNAPTITTEEIKINLLLGEYFD